MLDEEEWRTIQPLLGRAIEDIKRYREQHGVSLAEAQKSGHGVSALAKYRELTGFAETNVNALWHHRESLYGDPCKRCAKPLRTPNAKHRAECGHVEAA
jgi:hypothetical protein